MVVVGFGTERTVFKDNLGLFFLKFEPEGGEGTEDFLGLVVHFGKHSIFQRLKTIVRVVRCVLEIFTKGNGR